MYMTVQKSVVKMKTNSRQGRFYARKAEMLESSERSVSGISEDTKKLYNYLGGRFNECTKEKTKLLGD